MLRLQTKRFGAICFSLVILAAITATAFAQQRIGTVAVRVALDHANWLYQPGENVKAKISNNHVLYKNTIINSLKI